MMSSMMLKERLGLVSPERSEAERSEAERSAGPTKPAQRRVRVMAPDPEVSEKNGRRQLDGGPPGKRRTRQETHLGDDPEAGGRSELAHDPCRTRLVDEIQVRGDALE